MPQDIINAMRAMREDMRQRLMQAPEYRALEALDHSIEEISAIMREAQPAVTQPPVGKEASAIAVDMASPEAAARPQVGTGRTAIANAFAETLAGRIDQRRAAAFPLAHAAGG